MKISETCQNSEQCSNKVSKHSREIYPIVEISFGILITYVFAIVLSFSVRTYTVKHIVAVKAYDIFHEEQVYYID